MDSLVVYAVVGAPPALAHYSADSRKVVAEGVVGAYCVAAGGYDAVSADDTYPFDPEGAYTESCG